MHVMYIINCVAISEKHGYMLTGGTLFCSLSLDIMRPVYQFGDGPKGNMESLN